MTALELIEHARQHGIRFEFNGGRLMVDGPTRALTPELRAELRAQKRALVAFLHPTERFVALKGGLTVPAAALVLVLDLEARGLPLLTDADHQFVVPDDDPRLTPTDRDAIARWRRHLGALIEYRVPDGEGPL